MRSYCDSCVPEGLVDALQVVWQQTQQTGGQEDSSGKTADQTQQPAPHICKTNIWDQPHTYCSLMYRSGQKPYLKVIQTGPDFLPGSTQHGPAPRTMKSGANPNSSVMDSRTTSAPSLMSRAGISAGLTCSAAVSLPAGRRTEEEEPPPPLTNIFHVRVKSLSSQTPAIMDSRRRS